MFGYLSMLCKLSSWIVHGIFLGTYHQCLWWWRTKHNSPLGSQQKGRKISSGGGEDMHSGGKVKNRLAMEHETVASLAKNIKIGLWNLKVKGHS